MNENWKNVGYTEGWMNNENYSIADKYKPIPTVGSMVLKIYYQYLVMHDAIQIDLEVKRDSGQEVVLTKTVTAQLIYSTPSNILAGNLGFSFAAHAHSIGFSEQERAVIESWVRSTIVSSSDIKSMAGGIITYSSSSAAKIISKPLVAESEASKLSIKLPGMNQKVLPPCGCWRDGLQYEFGKPIMKPGKKVLLWQLVQHLNDKHRWSREKIADWLDDLHDAGKINIEF